MAKNVELLSVTTPHDVLHPRTVSDMVNVSDTKNLTQKLSELDVEFKKYLPLTGGTVGGNLDVNGNLTNGGNQVWHEGNLIPNENAVPNTIVKRSGTGNIATGQILNFQDTTQTIIGGITVDNATRELRHNYIPVGSSQQTVYDIWTKRNLPVESGEFTPRIDGTTSGTMTLRDAKGNYTRIGNIVNVNMEFTIWGRGTAQGNTIIHGLPFASSSNTAGKSLSVGWVSGLPTGVYILSYVHSGAQGQCQQLKGNHNH